MISFLPNHEINVASDYTDYLESMYINHLQQQSHSITGIHITASLSKSNLAKHVKSWLIQ